MDPKGAEGSKKPPVRSKQAQARETVKRLRDDEFPAFGAMLLEVSMRPLLVLAAALVTAGCTGAFAQTTPMPGIGATSPLGSMNFNAPSGSVGIPLGATEVDTGGTSPLPGVAQCAGGAMSSSGSSGSSGPFDGGGTSSGSGMGSSCDASAAGTSPGTTNTPAAGLGVPGISTSNTIPLGASELANPGVSPMIAVPAPGFATTPCGSASTTGGMSSQMGATSGSGC
jgi:hypothetical protein